MFSSSYILWRFHYLSPIAKFRVKLIILPAEPLPLVAGVRRHLPKHLQDVVLELVGGEIVVCGWAVEGWLALIRGGDKRLNIYT